MSAASTILFLLAYFGAGGTLLWRGQLLMAGVMMAVIAFVPLWWDGSLVDKEPAVGGGFWLMMTMPLPILLVGAGLCGLAIQMTSAIVDRVQARHD